MSNHLAIEEGLCLVLTKIAPFIPFELTEIYTSQSSPVTEVCEFDTFIWNILPEVKLLIRNLLYTKYPQKERGQSDSFISFCAGSLIISIYSLDLLVQGVLSSSILRVVAKPRKYIDILFRYMI